MFASTTCSRETPGFCLVRAQIGVTVSCSRWSRVLLSSGGLGPRFLALAWPTLEFREVVLCVCLWLCACGRRARGGRRDAMCAMPTATAGDGIGIRIPMMNVRRDRRRSVLLLYGEVSSTARASALHTLR